MEEFVHITLDHYHNLLLDNERANKMDEIFDTIRDIVDEEEFEKRFEEKDEICLQIFKIYEKILNL